MTTFIHGHSMRGAWSRTYYSWSSMVQRCNNPARNNWENYGGRGIEVCARWMTFTNFLADMGSRPAGTSLERSDYNIGYRPGNCTWATRTAQNRNRRNNKLCEADIERIRDLRINKVPMHAIARHFSVSRPMIGNIINGTAWRT